MSEPPDDFGSDAISQRLARAMSHEQEITQLKAQIEELESFIEGLANDHYARLSVLEWLRERKHDARTS